MSNKKGLAMPLHLACRKDESNPKYNYIYFIDGFAYVTNGHLLVKQSVYYMDVADRHLLDDKEMHMDCFKELCKCQSGRVTEKGIETTNANGHTAFFPFSQKVIKPEFEKVIADLEDDDGNNDLKMKKIDPKLIETATKCLCNEYNNLFFTFTFIKSKNAIKVTIEDAQDQLAIVMTYYD